MWDLLCRRGFFGDLLCRRDLFLDLLCRREVFCDLLCRRGFLETCHVDGIFFLDLL